MLSVDVRDWRTDLPATHWKRLEHVRAPQRPDVLVEHLVAGPSGIYVVTEAKAHASDGPLGMTAAALAADVVRAVVGTRYRPAVQAVLCVRSDGRGLSELSDGVLVVDSATLSHTMRCGTRVLSTSEVADVHRTLLHSLVPVPNDPWGHRRGWWRRPVSVAAGLVGAATLASACELALSLFR